MRARLSDRGLIEKQQGTELVSGLAPCLLNWSDKEYTEYLCQLEYGYNNDGRLNENLIIYCPGGPRQTGTERERYVHLYVFAEF